MSSQAHAFAPRGPDFNHDGFEDLAIGVLEDIGTATSAGLVNVLYGTSTGLGTNETITSLWQDGPSIADSSQAGDEFGAGLAWGDFNGDCFDDLAVGVRGQQVGGVLSAGAVHIFFGSSAGFSVANDFTLSRSSFGHTPTEDDFFGDALAAGDFNGDSFDDLAIGVPLASVVSGGVTSFDAGVVHVIYGGSGGLLVGNSPAAHTLSRATTNLEGDPAAERFGASLVSGDFNCDGRDDLTVGAPGAMKGTTASAGAVHIIYGGSSGLSPTAGPGDKLLFQPDAVDGEGNAFGITLAVGNFNGDIEQTTGLDHDCIDLAVGSMIAEPVTSGAIDVFYGTQLAGIQTVSPVPQHLDQDFGTSGQAVEDDDIFGWAMSQARADNDGFDDLVVGVPRENSDSGMVEIFRGTASGLSGSNISVWTQSLSTIPDSSESSDTFGMAVTYGKYRGIESMGGIAVGAPRESIGDFVESTGQVDVMHMANTSTPTISTSEEWWQDDLPNETSDEQDQFGTSLARARNRGHCLQ